MRRLLAATAALLALAPAAFADTWDNASGGVSAQLVGETGNPMTAEPQLSITRAGATFTTKPARCFKAARGGGFFCEQPLGFAGAEPLHVLDLDGEGEPEVLVELYTGGAHCCTISRVYRWNGTAWDDDRHDWSHAGFRLRDVDGDGRPEFVSGDARFAYEYTSYADSAFPLQIATFADGDFADVTAAYPDLLRRDARRLLRYVRASRREGRDLRGLYAAWLAEKYLLGESMAGWRRVRAAARRGELRGGDGWPGGKRYLRRLRRDLHAWGYTGSF